MKRFLPILLLICTLYLSSCGMFKELMAGKDEATVFAEDFCLALAADDIETAKAFLHPDSFTDSTVLSAYVRDLEQLYHFDFSNGVVFTRVTDWESAYYDSYYGGSVHELEYEMTVGGKAVEFFFTVEKNDRGYGLYNWGVDD